MRIQYKGKVSQRMYSKVCTKSARKKVVAEGHSRKLDSALRSTSTNYKQ